MARPPDVADPKPLSHEEIGQLTLEGMAALAARCALRVQPVFISEQHENKDQKHDLLAIDACITLSAYVGITGDRETHAEIASHASTSADVARASANRAAAAAAYAAGAAVANAHRSILAADSVAFAFAFAANASAYAARFAVESGAAADDAARNDLAYLLTLELGDPGTRGRVAPQSFFNRPLWDSDLEAPATWGQVMHRWRGVLSSAGVGDLYEWYERALRGEYDLDTAMRRVESWMKLNRQRAGSSVVRQSESEAEAPSPAAFEMESFPYGALSSESENEAAGVLLGLGEAPALGTSQGLSGQEHAAGKKKKKARRREPENQVSVVDAAAKPKRHETGKTTDDEKRASTPLPRLDIPGLTDGPTPPSGGVAVVPAPSEPAPIFQPVSYTEPWSILPPTPAGDLDPRPPTLPSPPLPLGDVATVMGDAPSPVDLLGRASLVKALAGLAAAPGQETPLTIALLGEWGSGKTTLMQLVQKRLEKGAPGRFDFAWFNAWEYEHTKNMAAGLAQEVVRGLVARAGLGERMRMRVQFAWREYLRGRGGVWVVYALVAAVLIGAVAWLGKTSLSGFVGEQLGSLSPYLSAGGALTVLAAAYYVFRYVLPLLEHPLSVNVRTYMNLPDYEQHLGQIPVLKRHLRTLCRLRLGRQRTPGPLPARRSFAVLIRAGHACQKLLKALGLLVPRTIRRTVLALLWRLSRTERRQVPEWLKKGLRVLRRMRRPPHLLRRLMLFVDDLDRCAPEAIGETFDAIRLVMDAPDVIVVVGIDPRVALRAVAKQYERLADQSVSKEEIARDFLGKIIQLPIRLSATGEQDLRRFVHERLFAQAREGLRDVGSQHAAQPPAEATSAGTPELGVQPTAPKSKLPTELSAGEVPQTQTTLPAEERGPRGDIGDPRSAIGRIVTGGFGTTARDVVDPRAPISAGPPLPPPDHDDDEPLGVLDLTDSVDDRERFIELARLFELHNPRQLMRLRNTYRLLKLIRDAKRIEDERTFAAADRHAEYYGFDDKELAWMLFWLESLNCQPAGLQARYNGWLLHGTPSGHKEAAKEGVYARVADPMRTAFGLPAPSAVDRFKRCEAFVNRVILPSAGALDPAAMERSFLEQLSLPPDGGTKTV